ncbi:MAG: hypothetical protein EOT05_00620 [Candidatus Microsaccharimonas sossegonensis]|uniref:Acyltransferase 3 domain-containing protein n=1 Tax=Candidatus Microsaccharimonas sossegonensis TaxID=2506948 RepID=A0A4Q0AGZ7_9BACT|nr:MAG: hypothetical protein EOT05_00620 [Candidatus Microsaccharimonas sossegonensis]
MPVIPEKKGRFVALDYLRGFFIIVIIVDHLNRWPSFLEVISGRGELWSSAAEGFVIISGLLLGYIRGFKDRDKSLKSVSLIVLKRALILYVWEVITTITLTVVTWYGSFKGAVAYVPIPQGDWATLLQQAITLQYTSILIHFLYLYAIFLAFSPLVIWLLRRSFWWLILIVSTLLWLIGFLLQIEVLQWQILFFIPATAGFYLEKILHWLLSLKDIIRRVGGITIVMVTVTTITISMLDLLPEASDSFNRTPLMIGRILIAFLWFSGLLIITWRIVPWLKKYGDWLLTPFGTRSLSVYIVHGIPLMLFSLFIPLYDNIWLNTFLGIGVVLVVWGILKIPLVAKIVPR